ncbi:MAG: copper amine oxidase N-terminal domain-containing protein, partial [Anaerotignaceae bacterium]
MKRFTSFLVCTILSLSSLGVSCNEVLANKEVSVGVIFNNEKLNLTLPILNQNDRTFYPFREILESMGATVSWNTDTKTATGTLNGNTVEFIINSNIYKVNGTLNNL